MHRPMFSPLSVPHRSIGLKPVPSIGTSTAAAPEPCPECDARIGPMSSDAGYPAARSVRSREQPSRRARSSSSSALVVVSSTQAAVWVSKNHELFIQDASLTFLKLMVQFQCRARILDRVTCFRLNVLSEDEPRDETERETAVAVT